MGPPRWIPQIGKKCLMYGLERLKKVPEVQLEGLSKRASVRTIGDWIVLEYLLGEASLASLRWGKTVQTTPRYDSGKVPEGPT